MREANGPLRLAILLLVLVGWAWVTQPEHPQACTRDFWRWTPIDWTTDTAGEFCR
jgi:hypothetical protein